MSKSVSKIEVDKGVPIPDVKHVGNSSGSYKYPFGQMEVGDSFSVQEYADTLRKAINNARKKYGHSYTMRKVGRGYVRVWRTG